MSRLTQFSFLATALALIMGATLLGDRPATIHLAGDSTMSEKREDRRPETGWGEPFAELVDPAIYRVVNHARNGRSTRSFIEEGRWDALVGALNPGDFVFIQFGHNDGSTHRPERYTSPEDYRDNLVRFVSDVRHHEATPVLMTPVVRRQFNEQGEFTHSHGAYAAAVRHVADSLNVLFVDMEALTRDIVVAHGPDASRELFLYLTPGEHPNYPDGLSDDTHFSPRGARLVAQAVLESFQAFGRISR